MKYVVDHKKENVEASIQPVIFNSLIIMHIGCYHILVACAFANLVILVLLVTNAGMD